MLPARTIVVAADFSEGSREAFRVACGLAAGPDARVHVVHVVEPPAPFGLLEAAVPLPGEAGDRGDAATLERLRAEYAPGRPLDVCYRVRRGAPADEILAAAGEWDADLVALGTHGRTGLERLVAGSVAEAVLRRAQRPVLAVRAPRGRPAGDVRVILHPTDFSRVSEPALVVARALARDAGARLVVFHASVGYVVEQEMALLPVDEAEVRESLDAARARADGPDLKFPVEALVREGPAVDEIVRAAADLGCDLIVMGTLGRGGLGRWILGSVAEGVLRHAPCATLVVKPTRRELEPAPTGGAAGFAGEGTAAESFA